MTNNDEDVDNIKGIIESLEPEQAFDVIVGSRLLSHHTRGNIIVNNYYSFTRIIVNNKINLDVPYHLPPPPLLWAKVYSLLNENKIKYE